MALSARGLSTMAQPFRLSCFLLATGLSQAAVKPSTFLLLQSKAGKSEVLEQSSVLGKLQRGFAGLSILEICLVVVLIVGVACLILLARRFQVQSARIQQLLKRIQGLQHVHMDNDRHLTGDQEKKAGLQRHLARMPADASVSGSEVSLEAKEKIEKIQAAGRVSVDFEKQLITLNQAIPFKQQSISLDSVPPKPEFADPKVAQDVLADLASCLFVLKGTVILVEGHTEGGVNAIAEVFFEVASQRAELVVATLVEMGVPPSWLESRGRPGAMGDNMNDVKIVTLSWCA